MPTRAERSKASRGFILLQDFVILQDLPILFILKYYYITNLISATN